MKRLVLAAFLSGQIGLVHAEIVIQAGEKTFTFADSEKDSQMVKGFKKYAEAKNAGLEQQKKLDQLKNEMGLGELERLAVSSPEPKHDDVVKFRGANTDQLFALLANENFEQHWIIIARTIGIVADEEAAKKLAAFATTSFPKDSEALEWHIEAREGAMWGLTLATRDQPMPWVREFLISHAKASQWVQDFGGDELDLEVAEVLAKNTRRMISRMGNGESLEMLKEIREGHVSKSRVQPASTESAVSERDQNLDHIDLLIKQTQEIAKLQAAHAEQAQ